MYTSPYATYQDQHSAIWQPSKPRTPSGGPELKQNSQLREPQLKSLSEDLDKKLMLTSIKLQRRKPSGDQEWKQMQQSSQPASGEVASKKT